MKPIFQEFYCPVCGQERRLKIDDICVNCRDIQILDRIIDSGKRNFSIIENSNQF
jgi:hypothetical protein